MYINKINVTFKHQVERYVVFEPSEFKLLNIYCIIQNILTLGADNQVWLPSFKPAQECSFYFKCVCEQNKER
jgi:hypothetical protein